MAELIRGKVARVINTREVALNVGMNSGVEVGMAFDILDAKSENIRDPDTGEWLGSIRRSKVRVRVTRVQEKLALATTITERRGLSFSFSASLMPLLWREKYLTLKREEKNWEHLDEEASYVKVGDPVLQVLQAEEEVAEEKVEEEVELSAN